MHVGYETVTPYPLVETCTGNPADPDTYTVTAMNRPRNDRSKVICNRYLTLTGVPENVDDYLVNGRSPLDWVIECYRVKTDKDSGITSDANAFRKNDPRFIVDMVGRAITVSLEAQRIIATMPAFEVT